jgi:hypothetical protein
MKYPTMQDVEAADKVQLAQWHRFLPSPGQVLYSAKEPTRKLYPSAALESDDEWNERYDREFAILARITARLTDAGGWDAQLSKEVGHTKPDQ